MISKPHIYNITISLRMSNELYLSVNANKLKMIINLSPFTPMFNNKQRSVERICLYMLLFTNLFTQLKGSANTSLDIIFQIVQRVCSYRFGFWRLR